MAVTRLVFRVANAVFGDQFIIAHDFQREGKGIDYLGLTQNIELAKQFLLASLNSGTDYSEKNKGTIEEMQSLWNG